MMSYKQKVFLIGSLIAFYAMTLAVSATVYFGDFYEERTYSAVLIDKDAHKQERRGNVFTYYYLYLKYEELDGLVRKVYTLTKPSKVGAGYTSTLSRADIYPNQWIGAGLCILLAFIITAIWMGRLCGGLIEFLWKKLE